MWDTLQVAIAMRQSEKSRQTDLKVSVSAAKAVRDVGVDQMALTRVAADAGFSSGAIYARCDDRSELVVMAWEKCFWPMLREVCESVLDAVLDCDPTRIASVAPLITAASAPDAAPDLGSAMEVVVASRRDEVVGEVVQRDFAALLDSRGVGPGTDGPNRQAAVAALATVFGAALVNSAHDAEGFGAIDPLGLLAVMADPVRRPTKPVAARRSFAPADPDGTDRPSTGDEVRDALLSATEYVIARSGFHRATISRIARRAGVSVGAIYSLYDNKDALVRDCIEVLVPPYTRRDVDNWSEVFASEDPRITVSAILRRHMSDDNAQWRRFRLECLVAARHSPRIAQMLSTYANFARTRLLKAMSARVSPGLIGPDASLSARASINGLALAELMDPTVASLDWRWIPLR